MLIPSKRCCDLCKNEIPQGQPFCPMSYPLSRDDKKLFLDSSRRRHSILGLEGIMVGGTPDAYQLEFCRACVDGILPGLDELKSEFLKRWFSAREEAQQRALQAE